MDLSQSKLLAEMEVATYPQDDMQRIQNQLAEFREACATERLLLGEIEWFKTLFPNASLTAFHYTPELSAFPHAGVYYIPVAEQSESLLVLNIRFREERYVYHGVGAEQLEALLSTKPEIPK